MANDGVYRLDFYELDTAPELPAGTLADSLSAFDTDFYQFTVIDSERVSKRDLTLSRGHAIAVVRYYPNEK